MAPSFSSGGDATQESHLEDGKTEDEDYDVSGNSGEEGAVAEQPAAEPPKWPLIQVVDPPPWLPPGWKAVLRTRENGSKDKYYVDPQSGRRFRSKTEVNYFLETGQSYRYMRRLKDSGVGPPSTSGKGISTDLAGFGPPSTSGKGISTDLPGGRGSVPSRACMTPPSYADLRLNNSSQIRCSVPTDLRTGVSAFRASSSLGSGPSRGGYKGARTGIVLEDGRRPLAGSSAKRNASDDRKPEGLLGMENKGKLILKLKRKTADSDEGRNSLKKPRPFEVVGPSTCTVQAAKAKMNSREKQSAVGSASLQAKARTSSREDQRTTNHAHEPSRLPVTFSAVRGSRKLLGKATPIDWLYQPQSYTQGVAASGSGRLLNQSNSNGLERASGSASMSITDSENIRAPRKESPSKQLQRLGKRLCQHALAVLARDYWGNGLHSGSAGFHSGDNSNGCFNTRQDSCQVPSARAQAPVKRLRGILQKQKTVVPMQRHGSLDHHHMGTPQPV